MLVFFSGGGSPCVPEVQCEEAPVMLSYYVDAKKNKPGSRLKKILVSVRNRKNRKSNNGKSRKQG